MTHGRAIRIYLADGTPSGIRTIEVGNWTIKAVVAPRVELGRLRERPEAGRAGVYFLLGEDADQPGRLRVYVGESDDVVRRQEDHTRRKEFWDTVVVFVSQDNRLTKGHVRWLEAELIRQIQEAKRAILDNAQRPEPPNLPEADAAGMSEFAEQVVLVISVLGFDIFPHAGWGTSREGPRPLPSAGDVTAPEVIELHAEGRNEAHAATGRLTSNGMVVSAGSYFSAAAPNLQRGYLGLRQQLIDEGALERQPDGRYRLVADYTFRSVSAAAAIITGSNRNGRTFWKLTDGRTLAQWEDAQAVGAGGQADEQPESV